MCINVCAPRLCQLSQEAERLRRAQAETSSSLDAEDLLRPAADAVRSVSDEILARRSNGAEASSSGVEVAGLAPVDQTTALTVCKHIAFELRWLLLCYSKPPLSIVPDKKRVRRTL